MRLRSLASDLAFDPAGDQLLVATGDGVRIIPVLPLDRIDAGLAAEADHARPPASVPGGLSPAAPAPAPPSSPARSSARIESALVPFLGLMEAELGRGKVVGAQVFVGGRCGATMERCFGTIAPGNPRLVDQDTMLGIGSCSKPIASACLLTLVDDGEVTLDQLIHPWLAAFRDPAVKGQEKAGRAPTLRELLAHRGGIYSQRDELNPS